MFTCPFEGEKKTQAKKTKAAQIKTKAECRIRKQRQPRKNEGKEDLTSNQLTQKTQANVKKQRQPQKKTKANRQKTQAMLLPLDAMVMDDAEIHHVHGVCTRRSWVYGHHWAAETPDLTWSWKVDNAGTKIGLPCSHGTILGSRFRRFPCPRC